MRPIGERSRMGLSSGGYFLVSKLRQEHIDVLEHLGPLLDSQSALATSYGYTVVLSNHPRTRNRLQAIDLSTPNLLVQFVKPFGFLDYNKLQMEAACAVSGSGTMTEETSMLNLRSITIWNAD